MKLDDGKPWFRRWMVIGFKPITTEGKLLVELMAGFCLAVGLLLLYFDDDLPISLAILVALSFVSVLAGFVLIYWKMEGRF